MNNKSVSFRLLNLCAFSFLLSLVLGTLGCATGYYVWGHNKDSDFYWSDEKTRSHVEDLVRETIESGKSVNTPDEYGATLLGTCLNVACSDETFELLKRGKADPNQRFTGLQCVSRRHNRRHGVYSDSDCNPEKEAIDYCVFGYADACKGETRKLKMFKYLLELYEATNQTFDKKSFLCRLFATWDNISEDEAKMFINQFSIDSVDLNAPCPGNGGTLLNLATHKGWDDIPEMLLKKGANINAADNDGTTPIMAWATITHRKALPDFMAKRKKHIAVNTADKYGRNAFDICVSSYGSVSNDKCNQIAKLGGRESQKGRAQRLKEATEKEGEEKRKQNANSGSEYPKPSYEVCSQIRRHYANVVLCMNKCSVSNWQCKNYCMDCLGSSH